MLIDDAIAMLELTPSAVKTVPFLAPNEPAVTFTTWDDVSPVDRLGYTIIPDGRELAPAIQRADKVYDLTRGVAVGIQQDTTLPGIALIDGIGFGRAYRQHGHGMSHSRKIPPASQICPKKWNFLGRSETKKPPISQ